jgi:putative transposase
MQRFGLSERRACRLVGVSRAAMRYCPRPNNDEALRTQLKKLAERYNRYGYLMLHGLLRNEGLVQNRKRTYRIFTELGLQVSTKRRKKLIRPRVPLDLPSRAGERWSIDFVHDQLSCGRRFRVLNVVDDFHVSVLAN